MFCVIHSCSLCILASKICENCLRYDVDCYLSLVDCQYNTAVHCHFTVTMAGRKFNANLWQPAAASDSP